MEYFHHPTDKLCDQTLAVNLPMTYLEGLSETFGDVTEAAPNASRFFDVAQIYDIKKGSHSSDNRPSDDVIRLLCWPLVQFFGTYHSHPE
jgi:hypothetical protein